MQTKDGREALNLAKEHRPDLILLRFFSLSDMSVSGREVNRWLKEDEELSGIPVTLPALVIMKLWCSHCSMLHRFLSLSALSTIQTSNFRGTSPMPAAASNFSGRRSSALIAAAPTPRCAAPAAELERAPDLREHAHEPRCLLVVEPIPSET